MGAVARPKGNVAITGAISSKRAYAPPFWEPQHLVGQPPIRVGEPDTTHREAEAGTLRLRKP